MSTVLREDIHGGWKATTLASGLSAGAVTLTVAAGGLSTWTPVTNGRIPVVINQGEADEEHLYAAAVSGDTLTGLTRGQDGTADQAHLAGARVTHALHATHVDRLNELLSLPAAKGDLLVASGVDTWAREAAGANDSVLVFDSTQPNGVRKATTLAGLTLTAPTLNAPVLADFTNAGHDHLDADDGGTLTPAAVTGLATAWTTYTPTFFNVTNPTGAFAYRLIGKTLDIRGRFDAPSTATAGGAVQATLPASLSAAQEQPLTALLDGVVVAAVPLAASATAITLWKTAASGAFSAGNSLFRLMFAGCIEVA